MARALAARIGGTVVSIDAILEEDRWDGGSEALFLRANRVAVERARPVLARGRPVVVDGNFYWSRPLSDLARRLRVPHLVVTLVVPLAECIVRDGGRTPSHGPAATRTVFRKAARVRAGIRIDGTPPVDRIVAAIGARLPPRPRAR